MKHTLIAISMLLLLTTACVAEQVTLEWDYTEDVLLMPDGGFRVYQKKQSDSVYPITAAATTLPNVHIVTMNVPTGKWCWTATAYKADLESDRSNEVCGQVRPGKPLNLRVP